MSMKVKFSKQSEEEGAVSEAIGFLIIFSLVMVGIGLIMLYGYPMLLETQSNANVRNMERDMIVIQNDMKSLVYKNVPYKETSLQVSGGALAVKNYSMTPQSIFTISSSDFTVDGQILTSGLKDTSCGHLIYESDKGESIIALENGAVFTRMEFQQGSAMLSEPRWFIDEVDRIDGGINRTFIITLISLDADGAMSRNGIGTVKMTLDSGDSIYYQSDYIPDPGMDIMIEYDEASTKYNFSKAWDTYLVNSLDLDPPPPSYILKNVNVLVIKKYMINIESL